MSILKTGFGQLLLTFLLLLSSQLTMASEADLDALKKALAEKMPKVIVSSVKLTPFPGVFEVMVGDQIVYLSKDARYMMNGDIIDLKTRKNLTDAAKYNVRLKGMAKLGEEKMLVYTPEKVEHTITVVTDIDCPYCRQLHSEMEKYMAGNVKVRYIFMPLKGPADFSKTVSVWCSKDKNKALDLAKSGDIIPPITCDNPIQEHLTTAREMGIRGTPAIILESGELIGGYVEAGELLAELKGEAPAPAAAE